MIISQTPLRISLAGGGTDLPGYYARGEGKVLSCAIDKYIYVIVKERFDDEIHVNYAKRKEVVTRPEDVKHELVREAMLMAGIKKGVEVTTLADIPSEGSGLGSSSSLTVGLLNAFYSYLGVQVDTETLAEQACRIEIVRCQKPIGRQDQYIAAYGGLKFFTFRRNGTVATETVQAPQEALRRLEDSLLLYFTNKTRNANTLLAEQSSRMSQNRRSLDRIRDLAVKDRLALEKGDADAIGKNLHVNWTLKKGLAQSVSDSDIDAFYSKARKNGALGGKVTGAGGGGFFLLYAQEKNISRLKKALKDHRELPIALEPDGSKIIFNIKRRVWK